MKLWIWSNQDPDFRMPGWEADPTGEFESLIRRAVGRSHNDVGPIRKWDPATLVECKRRPPGQLRDVLAGTSLRRVVSDRFKQVLERAAGGAFQFLPVTLVRGGKPLRCGTCWVANPLCVVDCLNTEASGVGATRGRYLARKGQYPPTIDPDRVPTCATAFAMRFEAPWLLAFTRPVIQAIKKARIQGVWFEGPLPVKRQQAARRRRQVGASHPMRMHAMPESVAPASAAEMADVIAARARTLRENREKLADSWLGRAVGRKPILSGRLELRVGKPASAAAVGRLQRALGVRLPESYVAFLKSAGWAVIASELVYGLGGPTGVLPVTRGLRNWKDLAWPKHLVVVGEDGRGGDYCLDLSRGTSEDCPVVYHDHELDVLDDRTDRIIPSLETIAPSFRGWIKRLARTR